MSSEKKSSVNINDVFRDFCYNPLSYPAEVGKCRSKSFTNLNFNNVDLKILTTQYFDTQK